MKLRPGSPEEVGMCSRKLERVREAMREWMVQTGQHATAAVVARRGVVVFDVALGRVRPEPDAPPTRSDTIFRIASISKPITATAAMILVEEGRLGLNLPVSFYVPELSGEGKDAITILHLLTHTSGMRDEDVDRYAEAAAGARPTPPAEPTQHPEIAEYLSLRCAAPLWKPPGQEMSYCNYGFCLLGEVVRRVSGQSFGDFASRRIFEPLGMRDTSFGLPDTRAERTAWPTDPQFVDYSRLLRRVPFPHAAGFSTTTDLAAFGQMFLDRGSHNGVRILSPTTVAAMTRNQIPGIGARSGDETFAEACWGLGWGVLEGRKGAAWGLGLASPTAYYHQGGSTFLWVDPAYEIVGAHLAPHDGRTMPVRYALTTRMFSGAYKFADAVTAAIDDA